MSCLLLDHARKLRGCLELTVSSCISSIKNSIFTTTSKISKILIVGYFYSKQRLIVYNERGKKGVIFTFIEDRLAGSLVRSSGRPHGAKRDKSELPEMRVGQLVRYFEYPPDHKWNGKLAVIIERQGTHREYKEGDYRSDWNYYRILIEGQVELVNGKYLFEVDEIDEL